MTIKISVSNFFLSTFIDIIDVHDCCLAVVISKRKDQSWSIYVNGTCYIHMRN